MGPQPTTLCDMISVVLTLCGHNRPVPNPSPGEARVLGNPMPPRSSQRRGLSLMACSVLQKKVNPKPGLGKRQHLSSHPLGRELSPLPQVRPGWASRTPGHPGAAQGPHTLLDSSALQPELILRDWRSCRDPTLQAHGCCPQPVSPGQAPPWRPDAPAVHLPLSLRMSLWAALPGDPFLHVEGAAWAGPPQTRASGDPG